MVKKKLLFIVILFGGLLSYFFLDERKTPGVDEVFLLPEGFQGCIYIYHNLPGEEELEIVDNKVVYEVPENGRILTSSPQNFLVNFGWHKIYVQNTNDEGAAIQEMMDVTALYRGGTSTTNSDKTTEKSWYLFNTSKETCQ
ncbi:MAG: hypothetical protein U9Q88_06550 [Bacillota bacterium]|nr:hypothetical protein [Bacillota bacterium]